MNFVPFDTEQAEDFRSLKSSPHFPISRFFTSLFMVRAVVDRRTPRKKQGSPDEANRVDLNHSFAISEKGVRKVLGKLLVLVSTTRILHKDIARERLCRGGLLES